jgi:hypothetical protein
MGAGASAFLPQLNAWITSQRLANPVPRPSYDTVVSNYLGVVNYAYANPQTAVIYLSDLQSRFFTTNCSFRWTWSEERPTTSLSALLLTTNQPANASAATESYRIVVEAIANNPEQYRPILDDIKFRYFNPAYTCNARSISSSSDYGMNLGPVFR